MHAIVDYFTNIPSAHRSAILFGGLTFFFLLESGIPLRAMLLNRAKHTGINLFFTFTTIVVNFLLAFILINACDWVVAQQFGLLQWMPDMSLWAFIVIGLLVLDFVGAYLVHWAEHKVKWMWRFHLIHHTDTHVDTTSANRHHPGESFFRLVFTTIGVVVCGAPIWLVMMYQSMSAALSQFNHANIKFPTALDRFLSWVIVTPGMHRVHHHYMLPYTDSNYGNIFAIWDRLLGTYRHIPEDKIVFGIDTHMDAKEHSGLGMLLKIPFLKYRQPTGSKFESD